MNFIVTAKRMEAHFKQKYILLIMQGSVKETNVASITEEVLNGQFEIRLRMKESLRFISSFRSPPSSYTFAVRSICTNNVKKCNSHKQHT